MHELEPWTNTTRYSPRGWKALVRLAAIVQKTDPKSVELALDRYMNTMFDVLRRENKARRPEDMLRGDAEESKPFLLMRAVFDLPEDAPRGQLFAFKGWLIYPDARGSERVNLGWPVSWGGGRPRLEAACVGATGPPYAAKEEYQYMRRHFKFRKLH